MNAPTQKRYDAASRFSIKKSAVKEIVDLRRGTQTITNYLNSIAGQVGCSGSYLLCLVNGYSNTGKPYHPNAELTRKFAEALEMDLDEMAVPMRNIKVTINRRPSTYKRMKRRYTRRRVVKEVGPGAVFQDTAPRRPSTAKKNGVAGTLIVSQVLQFGKIKAAIFHDGDYLGSLHFPNEKILGKFAGQDSTLISVPTDRS